MLLQYIGQKNCLPVMFDTCGQRIDNNFCNAKNVPNYIDSYCQYDFFYKMFLFL